MTPMRVIEVSTCPHTGQPMVLLQVEGRDRWLAFYLPMNEANRLARCLGMTPCACTPIFELTEQLVGHLGATVVRARLEGDERGISAGLGLDRGGAELLIPCHPADALALAVRARADRGGGRRPGPRPGHRHAPAERCHAGLAGPRAPRRFRRSVSRRLLLRGRPLAHLHARDQRVLAAARGLKIETSPSLTSNQSLPKASRMFGLWVTTRVLVPGSGGVPTRVRKA